ncbi:MAG TPA: transaldolase, partial [Ktedonobacterales bacterium]
MGESRLDQLSALGQSIWYDNISRDQLKSGELQRLIDEDAVVGVTSNPTIFEKAIDGSNYYDAAIKQLVASGQTDEKVIFTALTVEDIQMACDLLRPTYDRTKGEDGYVSIEVTPDAANDTKSTIFQTRALWKAVGRPNVMVKIPATAEGLPAIEQMTYEGVNINITLIFSLDIYEKVARAYIRGLGFRREEKLPLDQIHSVASFFVSRVDTLVDKQLDAKIAATTDSAEQEKLRGLHGKAAIANARLAYQKYLQIFKGAEFAPLAAAGATVQRCLWASTSTK